MNLLISIVLAIASSLATQIVLEFIVPKDVASFAAIMVGAVVAAMLITTSHCLKEIRTLKKP